MAYYTKDKKPTPFKFLLYRFWLQVKHSYVWLADNTDIHGIHLTINQETPMLTRLFFAIVSCCGMGFCSYLISLQVMDYKSKSTYTSITSTAYPVWKVRFPAVTVCNMNVAYKDHIKSVTDILTSRNIDEDLVLDMLQNVSYLITYEKIENVSKYEPIFDAMTKAGFNVDDMMKMLAHPCSSMLRKCNWQTNDVPCEKLFQTVRTTHGYCCSFNYYGTHNTSKYFHDSENLQYQYVRGAGSTFSLSLILDPQENQYVSPIRTSVGFTIQVQDGADYPDLDFVATSLLKSQDMTISVNPSVFLSSDAVRDIPLKKRNCAFHNEGNLEWSSIYTYATCITQCRAKAILKFCNCTPFYYPVQDYVRVCNLQDVPCLNFNKFNYSAMVNTEDLQLAATTLTNATNGDCICYPQCNENFFNFHVDISSILSPKFSNYSMLNVYYADNGCTLTERDLYTTWSSILGSIGGLFGLCMGGSLISILEILYFIINSIFFCNKYQGVLDERYQDKIKIDAIKAQMYPKEFQQPQITTIYPKDFMQLPNYIKKRPPIHPKLQIIINGVPAQY